MYPTAAPNWSRIKITGNKYLLIIFSPFPVATKMCFLVYRIVIFAITHIDLLAIFRIFYAMLTIGTPHHFHGIDC
jgi:hypothetical protein